MTVFARRRERLAGLVGDGLVLLASAVPAVRNNDVEHPFRQDSDFYYLTGFAEPGSVMLLDPSAPAEQFALFVRPRDREREIWDGRRAGTEGAEERFGADVAYPASELDSVLRERMAGRSVLYLPFRDGRLRRRAMRAMAALGGLRERFGERIPAEIRDLSPALAELRLRKTPEEAEALREACRITAAGHLEAMRFARPGLYEYQVQAAMEYEFRMRGARREGYPSIVASGENAVILHYTDNDRLLGEGDLVLIDAGAEYEYFSADITRTFPASGRFTAPQRAVYEAALAAHSAGLESARAGGSMREIHQAAAGAITEGLVELGLLPGPAERALACHHYREFFMHGTGHWLGMDVHDAGTYGLEGTPRRLEAGMAFTVEPGIYVDPEREEVELPLVEYDPDLRARRRIMLGAERAEQAEAEEREAGGAVTHPVPAELRGIGVRIEDDVLITEDGPEILTAAVPVHPDGVEEVCAQAPALPRP